MKRWIWVKLFICAFLIIGGWGNRSTSPVAAWVSIIAGVIILIWPLLGLVLSKKKKIEEPEVVPAVTTNTKPSAAAGSANRSGMYDYEYAVIGVYRPDTGDLPLPPIGAALEFENDPTNPYDDKAIKAVWKGQTVGWLYRKGKREMIRDWIDRGDYYVAEVTENDPELRFWIGMDRS